MMNYHNITYPDMNNGSGLRVVLWLSGCSHKCKGCQNPQTWDANSGIPFDKSAKEELFRELDKDYISGLTLSGGDPLFEDNLGDVLELVTEVNKRYNMPLYVDRNNTDNYNILNRNANEFRLSSPQKSIWLYTGYAWNDIWCNESALRDDYGLDYCKNVSNNHKKRQQITSQCDVLVDGRYIDSQRDISLAYRGSSNQHLINIQQSLQKGEVVLWKP